MFDSRLARTLIALGVAAGPLMAAAAPVVPSTPPTPPPCAADGSCHPDTAVWGYTPPKWRRWPGAAKPDQRPGEARPELPRSDPPKKELEDQMAPPPVEAIEPRRREIDEPERGTDTDEGFAPRRPGENRLPPPVPRDEALPRNDFPPPQPDNTPDFLRGNPSVPGINPSLIPPGGAPPQFGPGLGPSPLEQGPPGQPPSGPTEPTLRDPTAPAGGGRDPDEDMFPNFNMSTHSDDAPPALPFRVARGGEGKGWSPSSPTRGTVSPAPTNIPQPTAPAASSRTSSAVAPAGGIRKVDPQVQRTSYDQDSPPTLPPTFLQ